MYFNSRQIYTLSLPEAALDVGGGCKFWITPYGLCRWVFFHSKCVEIGIFEGTFFKLYTSIYAELIRKRYKFAKIRQSYQ